MKKLFMVSSLLISMVCNARDHWGSYERQDALGTSKNIAYALFSYQYQDDLGKTKVDLFVDEVLATKVFHTYRYYGAINDYDVTVETLAAAVQWISEQAVQKTRALLVTQYRPYFSEIATANAEQTEIVNYTVNRLKIRTSKLLEKLNREIAAEGRYWFAVNENFLYKCKGALRTFVGNSPTGFERQIKLEIEDALRPIGQCPFYCGIEGKTFVVTFPCGHVMHRTCYKKWTNSQFERGFDVFCPECKKNELEQPGNVRVLESYSTYHASPSNYVSNILTGIDLELNNVFVQLKVNWKW